MPNGGQLLLLPLLQKLCCFALQQSITTCTVCLEVQVTELPLQSEKRLRVACVAMKTMTLLLPM
jgi:hypothetical protein